MHHQIHFDRKFYQDLVTEYWISTDYPRTRAHQWVWFNHHGKPPRGYHIHHVNHDRSDNRIENLELIKAGRHTGYHMSKIMLDPEKKKKAQEQCARIRPMTKEWHRSEEGHAWHSYHAIKNKFGNWEPTDKTCEFCGKVYQTKKKSRSRFCHLNCKMKFYRREGRVP